MYVHTSFPNIVYALDLSKEGAPQIWKYTPQNNPGRDPDRLLRPGEPRHRVSPERQDLHQRAAGRPGRDRREDRQGAVEGAAPGQVRRRRPKPSRYKDGATITNAPIVIKDIVITGISGGEFGVRGRVSAFDVNTGKHLWTAYSTGPDSETLVPEVANANYPSHKGKDLGVTTWQGDEWKRGGGTTWGWYSYDPELNLFYYNTGNPGSWNPDQRPGDNKWSMTMFARNPETGRRSGPTR